jgi:hypothetical protein
MADAAAASELLVSRSVAAAISRTVHTLSVQVTSMDWYVIAPFLIATFLLLITPGPVMVIVGYNTLRYGVTAGLLTVLGVELGEICLL